ncbi:MAG: DUF2344 domain-containing protein, partial [Chitinispirillaceae bacterium]|nr:DUF2344 domain-containing protein [Chitinispirillaceae bacterium]
VADLIHHAWQQGARFDGWNDHFNFPVWKEAAQRLSLDFAAYRDAIPHDQELPWSAVSTGVDQGFLVAERDRALAREITPDCRDGACTACGACGPVAKKSLCAQEDRLPVTEHVSLSNPARASLPEQIMRYRFLYSKGREVRFLGHLDMVEAIVRALIAAGCTLAYSQGFQPHPRVSFGPPLPCGVMSRAEAFDVFAPDTLAVSVESINRMLPEGLRVVSYAPVAMDSPSITASIKAGEYTVTPLDPVDPATIRERIAEILEAGDLPVTIEKNGKRKVKNIRPLILTLSCEEQQSSGTLLATLSLDPRATCKPLELIAVLFPGSLLSDFSVCRTACLVERQGTLVSLAQT